MNPVSEVECEAPGNRPERRAYSIKGFCEAYDVSRAQVYNLLAAGQLRAVRMGKKTLVTAESVDEWFASLPAFKSGTKAA